jgi:hypothetical protein
MSEDSERGSESKKTKAVVDRVEDGGVAVVHLGDDEGETVDLPASLLPDGVSDGDHLTITVRVERASRASAEERIRALQERLANRGGS